MSDGGDESIPVFSRASLTLGGLLRNHPRRMSPPNQLADDHGDCGKQQQVEDISVPCDCGFPMGSRSSTLSATTDVAAATIAGPTR
jgi:hypothetical protein